MGDVRERVERLLGRPVVARDGCWIVAAGGWTDAKGAPMFRWRGVPVRAARAVYEAVVGQPPRRHVVTTVLSCGRIDCVRPDHLAAVSRSELSRAIGGFCADQAARTECPQGHAYTPENTYIDAKGCRHCRHCWRDRARARYHERKRAA